MVRRERVSPGLRHGALTAPLLSSHPTRTHSIATASGTRSSSTAASAGTSMSLNVFNAAFVHGVSSRLRFRALKQWKKPKERPWRSWKS
jgi:hypothetical protein